MALLEMIQYTPQTAMMKSMEEMVTIPFLPKMAMIRLIGGSGNDYLNGGNGADTYIFEKDLARMSLTIQAKTMKAAQIIRM